MVSVSSIKSTGSLHFSISIVSAPSISQALPLTKVYVYDAYVYCVYVYDSLPNIEIPIVSGSSIEYRKYQISALWY